VSKYPGEEYADFRAARDELYQGVPQGQCRLRYPILSWGKDFQCIDEVAAGIPASSLGCIPVSTRARRAVQRYGVALVKLHQVKRPGEPTPPGIQMAAATGDVAMSLSAEASELVEPVSQQPWPWSCDSFLARSCACIYQGLMRIEWDLRAAALYADWIDQYRRALERGAPAPQGGGLKAAGKVAAIGTAGAAVTALLMLWGQP